MLYFSVTTVMAQNANNSKVPLSELCSDIAAGKVNQIWVSAPSLESFTVYPNQSETTHAQSPDPVGAYLNYIGIETPIQDPEGTFRHYLISCGVPNDKARALDINVIDIPFSSVGAPFTLPGVIFVLILGYFGGMVPEIRKRRQSSNYAKG
jgi:hypothetical protein